MPTRREINRRWRSEAASERRLSSAASDPPLDAGEYRFKSGKHEGETIAEVHESDPEYLTWWFGAHPTTPTTGHIRRFLERLGHDLSTVRVDRRGERAWRARQGRAARRQATANER